MDEVGLNAVQGAAVAHGEGPLLLLAGAGTGKTRALTHRLARLIGQGIDPRGVLALTFTNKAAQEMKARVAGGVGAGGSGQVPALRVCTFHALGAHLLRENAAALGRTRSFTIFDEDDQRVVAKRALEAVGIPAGVLAPRALRRLIGRAKDAGRALSVEDLPLECLSHSGALDLGSAYEAGLRRANAFDFGDLILRPTELLRADPALAGRYRGRWRWLLVDEFQDTNAVQFELIKTLAPPGSAPNLFVVGDDDQSIYGWRGAEVGNILGFQDVYPSAEVLRLEQNYRSTQVILRAANGVIAHNQRRLGKSLWTEADEGAPLELYEAHDPREEGRWVAAQIATLCAEEGYSYDDVAVFFRANSLSLDVEEALRAAGIHYELVRGRSFYERAEVRDALAYLRLLVNPADDVAFLRAAASPPRGIGGRTRGRLGARARARSESLWSAAADPPPEIRGRPRTALRGFVDTVGGVARGGRPSERARAALEGGGLLPALRRADEGAPADRPKAPNVERLLLAVEAYEAEVGEGASLAGYLERVKLVSDQDAVSDTRGTVRLMTVHAAKGLEFPVVFVVGMEEGIFPNGRALEADLGAEPGGAGGGAGGGRSAGGAIEEERRLCYVAFTRAERRLFLSRARYRRQFGAALRANAPSRFLHELPEGVVAPRCVREISPRRRVSRDWTSPPVRRRRSRGVRTHAEHGLRVGSAVWHAEWGAGEVVALVSGGAPRVRVRFADLDEMTILASYLSAYDRGESDRGEADPPG